MEAEFKISSWVYDHIFEVVIEGHASDSNAKEIEHQLLNLFKGHNNKLRLIDIRHLEGRTSTVFSYYQVMEFPIQNVEFHAAIVDNVENKDFYTFHETAAVNRGFTWRYFNDIDKARAWLLT